jgi:hypothetical protein
MKMEEAVKWVAQLCVDNPWYGDSNSLRELQTSLSIMIKAVKQKMSELPVGSPEMTMTAVMGYFCMVIDVLNYAHDLAALGVNASGVVASLSLVKEQK